jgi:EpsI family protein
MSAARWRAVWVLLAMAATVAVAVWTTPTLYLSDKLGKPDLETLFPKEFADWRLDARAGLVLPSPETQALLDSIYNQTLTRTYINTQGYRIMLSVAYGGDQSDATRAHMPEVCYPAQGFQITANNSGQITLDNRPVAVRYLMSKDGNRNEPITYWMVVGDRVSLSRTDQKLAQFALGLKGYIPDGMLVRVSSIDENAARGHQAQEAFLQDLAVAVPQQGRDRVFGSLK